MNETSETEPEQDNSGTQSDDADTPSDPRLAALDEGIAKVKQDLAEMTGPAPETADETIDQLE